MINKFKLSNRGKIVHIQAVDKNPANKITNLKPVVVPVPAGVDTTTTDDKKVLSTVDKTFIPVERTPEQDQYEKHSFDQLHEVKKLMAKVEITYSDVKPLVKVSTAIPYFIVTHGYYLAFDSGRVLFLDKPSRGISKVNIPTILKKPIEGSGNGVGVIKQSSSKQVFDKSYKGFVRSEGTNLTQADLDNILKGKPSAASLLSVYNQYTNEDITIDVSKATPVW